MESFLRPYTHYFCTLSPMPCLRPQTILLTHSRFPKNPDPPSGCPFWGGGAYPTRKVVLGAPEACIRFGRDGQTVRPQNRRRATPPPSIFGHEPLSYKYNRFSVSISYRFRNLADFLQRYDWPEEFVCKDVPFALYTTCTSALHSFAFLVCKIFTFRLKTLICNLGNKERLEVLCFVW